MTVAALFVETGGAYFGLPDVDPWDLTRDARLYAGPHPVVAHPPCSTWCQLAKVNEARYGHRVGDDGGCFKSALAAVRRYGGVLEHPAYTYAWRAHGLIVPRRGAWSKNLFSPLHRPEFVTEVSQSAYGHAARKRTWLLWVGTFAGAEPPPLDWRDPEGTAWVGNDGSANAKRQLGKREAKASPPAFRDVLLSLARSAQARSEAA